MVRNEKIVPLYFSPLTLPDAERMRAILFSQDPLLDVIVVPYDGRAQPPLWVSGGQKK